MKVEAVGINNIFTQNRVLKIPFFQRGYVWEEQKNWRVFFDDIYNIACAESDEEREKYFLGSIILKKSGFKNGAQYYDVIDGQQRLTTIVIFMKALYLALGRNDLFNHTFMQLNLVGETIPILVTNYNDKSVYDEILNLEVARRESIHEGRKIADAFAYFVGRILDAQNPTDGSAPVSAVALLNAIVDSVRIVSIEVEGTENAQKIFETINCTGIRLTTGEMLKNFLFEENMIDEYERTWKQVFESSNQKYWEGDLVAGRVKSGHIENFFYRYMLIKMQQPDIKKGLSQSELKEFRQKDGLFDKFRRMIKKFGIRKEAAINEIVEYARLYLNIFKDSVLEDTITNIPGIERLAYLMSIQDSWTMTPYILYICKNVESHAEQTRIFSYLETYLMRRIICKSKNNNYSDLFSENLIGQQVKTFEDFKNYVNDADARGALLMPSDKTVIEAVKTNDLKRDAQVVLYMLESKLNRDFVAEDRNNSYEEFTKELLMPENNNSSWPMSAGFSDDQRKVLVKTLGNFVMLREKLKPKYKTAEWTNKRDAMKPFVSGLQTCACAERELPVWDDAAIEARNKWLAARIIESWPLV